MPTGQIRFARGFASLSEAVLFAALAVPTLIAIHLNPQTVFFAEWYAALGLAVFCLLYGGLGEPVRPVRVGVPVWCALVLCVAIVAGTWTEGSVAFALYLLLFLMAYGLAAHPEEAPQTGAVVAFGLLGCAVLQSVAGAIQLVDWNAHGLVMHMVYSRAFGNIGQANHYADLLFLGLASLCLLRIRDLIGRWTALGLAVWLSLSAAASASRGALLFMAAFVVLGALALWRGDATGRRMGRALLWAGCGAFVAQVLVTYGHLLDALGIVSALERTSDAGSNGQHFYNWTAAWQAILAHPWFGQGPASFYKASIDAMFTTPPTAFPKFAEHAHNLPLNLAAEFGIPIGGGITVALLWWYLRHMFAPVTPLRVWALACLATIGLHAMVEYPLWYSYFLIPAGMCMGVCDAGDARLPSLRWPRMASMLAAVLAVSVLAWVLHDWFAVRKAYEYLSDGDRVIELSMRTKARARLDTVSRYSVLALQAESLRLQSWYPDEGGAGAIADRCDAHWHYKPGWYLMMRCGEAYAQAGRASSLNRLLLAMCDGFPRYRSSIGDWARAYDAKAQQGLRIHGRACLR